MARLDYTISFKSALQLDALSARSNEWTLFVSAYNASRRVSDVFEAIRTPKKHWLRQREYQYEATHLLPAGLFGGGEGNESDILRRYREESGVDLTTEVVCLDITGFMRPLLMHMVAFLIRNGVRRFFALYSDPARYRKNEDTVFSKGSVTEVRQVSGFEGLHIADSSNDVLVIGAGYDDELMRRVAEAKANAKKLQMFGFPSLSADMYQQSVLRASKAAETIGVKGDHDLLFAPANDPFVTAQVLSDRIESERRRGSISNLYLSPLGTKPQALGFALFYEMECRETSTSIIFPFSEGYESETTEGIARTWVYEIESFI
jgi:hypothetical protein